MGESLHDPRMNTIMNVDNLKTIEQMEDFLTGSQAIAFAIATNKDERYRFVEKILRRFHYGSLKRADKGVVIRFLGKTTGYSRQQLTRMIERFMKLGELKRSHKAGNGFERVYTPEDIQLLAKLDQRHETPNGFRVKKLCERAHEHFSENGYERLAGISVAHIYNLRKSSAYKKQRVHYEKTHSPKGILIGERRKPQPDGKPGYIRIDTVHQGDLDGQKGVYHINAVDEMTQFEIVVSVEKISENHLIPALEALLAAFPFKIFNFHSDNGSEYINKTVARLLEKLWIEFTKSRPRISNDNALAEGKNAAIVRKIFGFIHISQKYADKINIVNFEALNPYVNYHRPCLYPTLTVDSKGKQKKKYDYDNMMTPYEKFKSLPEAEQYLQAEMTFAKLDDMANAITDNAAADFLQQQRKALFKTIHEDSQKAA